jgi:regulator of nucleoside diphosphate kinase
MNSTIRVRNSESREEEFYTLVFPEEADISRGLISVLAPVGIALLGHRKGELIEAKVPGGTRRLKIVEVKHGSGLPNKKVQEQQPVKTGFSNETRLTA